LVPYSIIRLSPKNLFIEIKLNRIAIIKLTLVVVDVFVVVVVVGGGGGGGGDAAAAVLPQ
jgi:hypothetical protein